MKEDKEKEWKLFRNKLLIPFSLLGIILFFVIPMMNSISEESQYECSVSEYNTYSNSTTGYLKKGNKCYVKVYNVYTTNEVCRGGFLDIGQSCYESSKERTEMYTGEVCFNLDNGERC